MAMDKGLERCLRGLRATFPLVGTWRRRRAVQELAERRGDPQAVPLLAEACALADSEAAACAEGALKGLESQPAIDALCALWARGRDGRLDAIIAEKGYVAKQPLDVRLLSALRCGKIVPAERADLVPFLLRLLSDGDATIRTGAEKSLRNAPAGPGQDALCEEAIKDPRGAAAKLCVETGKRPADHERCCLLLFVTRQLDAYFKEDFKFQALHPEYERADATVQGYVMDVIRSGDRRCAGFFGIGRKPLQDCSEAEVMLALDSWVRHKDWERLFHACLELPLRYSFPRLAVLSGSGWEPESADLRSTYRQMLADAKGQPLPAVKKPEAESSLFERWLQEGRTGDLARADERSLLDQLGSADPVKGVAIVGALSQKSSSAAAQAVRQSPHWLVRLAGHATGLLMDLTQDAQAKDPNYWVCQLSGGEAVLEFWPGKATPADLEALSAAPSEAWVGKLGAARKVLRTVMGYRVTTGVFEPMVVDAHELAAEFVSADEAEPPARPERKGKER